MPFCCGAVRSTARKPRSRAGPQTYERPTAGSRPEDPPFVPARYQRTKQRDAESGLTVFQFSEPESGRLKRRQITSSGFIFEPFDIMAVTRIGTPNPE